MITFRSLGKLGRFGNQLFQYAGTRLYAEQNGFAWAFPDWDGTILFQSIDDWSAAERLMAIVLPTAQLADMRSTHWNERILSPVGLWRRSTLEALYRNPRDNRNLYGYLQSEFALKQLRGNTDAVRNYFRFKPDIDEAFRLATEKYRPWLAVHLRFGDMVKRGITSNTGDALKHIERLQGRRNLFVATDSPDVKQKLMERCPIAPENPLPELPPFAFDFWMLKESDILIGSGSTFSWWAAFLGKQVVYWSPPLNRTWKGTVPPIVKRST